MHRTANGIQTNGCAHDGAPAFYFVLFYLIDLYNTCGIRINGCVRHDVVWYLN